MPQLPAAHTVHVPHFALPTASNLIHVMSETPKQAQLVLDSHEAHLRTCKQANEGRSVPAS